MLRLRLVVGNVVPSLGLVVVIPLLGVKMRCSQRLEEKHAKERKKIAKEGWFLTR